MHTWNDPLEVFIDLSEHFGANARHDAHVDDSVGGIGKLHANLRHRRANGAHGKGHDVHGPPTHAAAEKALELLAHDVGVFPVVGGPRVVIGEGADDGAVFCAGGI